MNKILCLVAATSFLVGCSSVTQPTAQRALVEHEYVDPAQAVSSSIADALSNGKSGDQLNLSGGRYVIGEVFFAASGLTCRNITSSNGAKTVFCQRKDGSWFKVNRVISEYKAAAMSEAMQ